MALSKNQYGYIFIGTIAVIGISFLMYIFRCNIFKNLSSCVPDPNKNNTPIPAGSPTPKWIPETPPYNIGMFGVKIKALQSALGITADGKFGNQTKGAVIAKGYVVPLSQSDYDAIINPQSQDIGKIAYANKDGVPVYKISDYSVYKTANNGDWIGTVTGTQTNFYLIKGGYRVPSADVDLK